MFQYQLKGNSKPYPIYKSIEKHFLIFSSQLPIYQILEIPKEMQIYNHNDIVQ